MKVHVATSRPEEIGNACIGWACTSGLPFEWSSAEECDVFISVLYDTIIPKEFIQGRRCYNFHPGILPQYRGAGVYSWVLINKEKETGVTLHEIDPDIDHGPIIAVSKTAIEKEDTAGSLFDRCMFMLFRMFIEWFPKLLSGDYEVRLNGGGRLYLRKDLEVAKDITHIIRAFTFDNKESTYWYDSKGIKRYVLWE